MPESTDLEVRRDVAAMTADELKRTFSIAKALALSKRFPDARTADEAFAKILVGRDLGLSPTQALTGLHIVEGKPQIAAVTLAGFVRKSDRYDYTILHHTEESCRISFFETRWASGDAGHGTEFLTLGVSEFTMEEALRAGLVKPKSNWEKWPRNMLFARAMSNGVKWFCPDLMGGVPIYTEADLFESTATELTSGEGSGEPVGWQGISVEDAANLERVLSLAAQRGHGGLANRSAVEMIVNGQPAEFVREWIDTAMAQLADALGDEEIAEVILDAAHAPMEDPDRAAKLEARRGELLDEIAALEDDSGDEGEDDARLRDELEAIEAEIGAGNDPGQGRMDMDL